MENYTVLLAEDEIALAHILRESLEERGFKVRLCPNGAVALKLYNELKPDIVVLDIMMPVLDGFAVAKQIRLNDKHTPIIFLTAKSQVKDLVAGFELGANDYLKKPFSVEELIVRIRVQLNKQGILPTTPKITAYNIGDFTFLANRNLISQNGVDKILTSRESDVLKMLCDSPQQVVSKATLLTTIWGNDSFFNARSLDVFVSKLRKYFNEDPNIKIINVRGVGYRLVY
ncbi:MAG: response regulator transcription factor [Pedobacter sp.]|nr:MAG: response regulator transcription factor [Pedobacter sp.]